MVIFPNNEFFLKKIFRKNWFFNFCFALKKPKKKSAIKFTEIVFKKIPDQNLEIDLMNNQNDEIQKVFHERNNEDLATAEKPVEKSLIFNLSNLCFFIKLFF